jgi:hypothetical protein
MSDQPIVPLTKALSIGELLEAAAKEMPQMDQDGAQVAVKYSDDGLKVVGTVRVKDFSGSLIGEFTAEGNKSLTGVVTWKF